MFRPGFNRLKQANTMHIDLLPHRRLQLFICDLSFSFTVHQEGIYIL